MIIVSSDLSSCSST